MSESLSPRPSWRLLGPLSGSLGGRALEPGPPLRRALLAVLIAHAGAPVSVPAIIGTLWGERPPEQAVNVVQKHVGSLRRLVDPHLARRAAGSWLIPAGDGYRIDTDQADLDVVAFRALVRSSRQVREPGPRLSRLIEALALWRGQAGDGIGIPVTQAPAFFSLNREHAAVSIQAAELAVELGRADEVLPALRLGSVEHPTDELLHAQLIRALASAGLRSEAAELYVALRGRLVEDLGIEPGPALRAAHAQLLADDVRASEAPRTLPPPAEIPADQAAFVARGSELRLLRELADQSAVSAVVVVITGPPGVGKTSLAVHHAHRVADLFPDGGLYVDLRGFDPREAQREPAEVLGRLLGALDLPHEKIPADPDARSALLRSVMATRRMLLLLDNARDAEHVRSMLPGSPGSMVLVTSRAQLLGLRAGGASGLALSELDTEETRQFLAARLGTHRLFGQESAVRALAELSGGLPLALAVTAARAAQAPEVSMTDVADQLRSTRRRLDSFDGSGDPRVDVRSVFSWSYHALSDDAAALFPLLALHPGPDVSLSAAASLADVDEQTVRTRLDELAAAGLVIGRLLGGYHSHDLLRAYSAELLAGVSGEQVAAARDRLYGYASTQAVRAARAHSPDRILRVDGDVPDGSLGDLADAQAWFDTEQEMLVSLVDRADNAAEDDVHLWRIGWALMRVLDERGRWDDLLLVLSRAVEAANRSGPWITRTIMHTGLARVLTRHGRFDDALAQIDSALALMEGNASAPSEQVGDLQMMRAELHRLRSWTLEEGKFPLEMALVEAEAGLAEFDVADRSIYRAHALAAVGWFETRLGHHDAALAHARQAAQILDAAMDYPQGRADTLEVLAHAHYRLGELTEAVRDYAECLRIWQYLGYPSQSALISVNLAEVLVDAQDVEGGRSLLEQALEVYEQMGHEAVEGVRSRLAALSSDRPAVPDTT